MSSRPSPSNPAMRLAPACALIAIAIFLIVGAMVESRHPDSTRLELCANNLRQIGLQIQGYMTSSGGQCPDSLEPLLADGVLPADAMVCPDTNDTPARGPTTQAVQANLTTGGHLSFIYIGRGLTKDTLTDRTVLVYEPLANHETGLHVLFADVHVEFLPQPAADQFLAKVAAGKFPVTWP